MATVLVVDDNAANRELIVTLLTYKGNRPLEAADGAEGLALVFKERPDLVICDILMPTMDGYEFVRQLRADPAIAHTEVIFYSAHYREQEAHNLARACGVSRVLIKPCVPEDIIEAIDGALAHETPLEVPPLTDAFDREHLRLMTDKLSEQVEMLKTANHRLSALTELNVRLASERDPHTLLDQVCRGARDLIGAKYAVLAVAEKGDGQSVYSTVSGIPASAVRDLVRPRIDNNVLGPVMSESTSRRFMIPTGDARAAGLPSGYPSARSVLACPIASLSTVHGWIALFDKVGADEFSEEDERLMSVYASQVGRIYESGSLFAEVKRHAACLQDSELRFRQLAENIREVFFLISADSTKLLYISPAYEAVWGRTCESLYARPESWMDSVHPDDLQTVRKSNQQRDETGRVNTEYRIVRPDGTVRWISARGFPIHNEAGEVYRIAGIAEDITERKEAETRITRLNRIHAVLSGINALIVRVRDREELFREACRIAVDAGQFRLAWVGVVDREAMQIRPVSWHGVGDDYMKLMPLGLTPGEPGTYGLAGRAVTEGKPMVSDDMATDARIVLSAVAARRGFHSLGVLPLAGSGGVVAVLALYAGETGFFDAEEMKLLSELAGDIAFALDHISKEERLDYLAYYDTLTGLANPTLFRDRLAQHVAISATEHHRFAVVLIDIVQFKAINDALGRQAGDQVLKRLSARLTEGPGGSGTIARLGADHFAIVIDDSKHVEDVARALDELQSRCLAESFVIEGNEVKISIRAGIAVYPGDGADADALIKNAEVALRGAKSSGESRVFYTQEMTQTITRRMSLEKSLGRALERDEFVLHYQPKVDVESRRIQGVEALIRWRSPDLGLVPPLKFIPVLEETGMILEVGAWVLRRAVHDHRQWQEQKLTAPRVAVNVSAVQLRRPDFVDVVKDILRQGASPPGIDIEITESLIMDDVEDTIRKLKTLRGLGLELAIDDFGTGYSSLGYLGRLPVQALKIDRSFIVKMTDDPDAMTLVTTIISLAHSLGLKVVAEGVETDEQATVLRLLRCDEMQGYLVSRPVPLEELTPMLLPGNR
jgi:diguanylate cyclase (GGDEF)-like protein/PAS domain S-box-containing protein